MSYRIRLVITIVLLIAVTFSIGGTLLVYKSFQITLEAETKSALDSYKTVINTLSLLCSMDAYTDTAELGKVLAQMSEENMGRWKSVALWAGDDLIYQDGNEPVFTTDFIFEEGNQYAYVQVNDANGHGLIIESEFKVRNQELRLLGRFDLSSVYQARKVQQRLYIAIYIAVLFFGMITAVFLSYALTGKLRKLTVAVRKISGGSLSTRSNITSDDEFGQLSRDFDAMADKLQENIDKLESSIQRQENFMGNFAHELKTPMTSIIGFADLLRQGNLDENTRMMAAEYIYSEGHRLERLSFKLLDLLLLKKDNVAMKRVWLSGFVGEIDKAMSPNLKNKNIRFICRSEQGKVYLEPDLVKSLLYNLIDNASKAMEGEGIIVLTASIIQGGCQFEVVDNGRGMEQDELSKITDAFYRVDKVRSRAQGGAGLGLALCKQIVEIHKGNIQFDSVPGKGTRVKVALYGKAGKKRA